MKVREEITNHATYPRLHMMRECDGRFAYSCGAATTRYGVVAIYEQRSDPTYTDMWMVYEGRTWQRTIARVTTERGLLVLAGRFAREVVEGGA